jgi:hypothetical protein
MGGGNHGGSTRKKAVGIKHHGLAVENNKT